MNLLETLDAEIERLTRARALLATDEPKRRGRPKGSSNGAARPKRKSGMTAAGRARIAKAMRERWAKRKAEAKGKAKA